MFFINNIPIFWDSLKRADQDATVAQELSFCGEMGLFPIFLHLSSLQEVI